MADVELGDEAYNYSTEMNGHPAAMAMIYQKAGSNASETINEIDAVLDELGKDLPKGLEFVTLNDTNIFLKASIKVVLKTLLEAILLVVLVVYVFLHDIRSTLIPTIGIVVSIVGTFAFMAVVGFSVNLITLFALVLAIGTVVDDAIIVVEAVQARFDIGYRSSYMATNDAMRSVASAIDLYADIHGRVYSRFHDGRYIRRILQAIRHHDGRSCGDFSDQCIYPFTCLVRFAASSLQG